MANVFGDERKRNCQAGIENRPNFLFFGFAIPDREMQEIEANDEAPAIQTHRFNKSLIRALESTETASFTYISSKPVSDYPRYPAWLVRGKKSSDILDGRNIRFCEIPFINIAILKPFSRFISGALCGIVNYHGARNKAGIVVYSVHVPYMALGYLFSRIYGVPHIAIWTDPPAQPLSTDIGLKAKFRNLEQSLARFLMRRVDKVIALTPALADDFAPQKPSIIVEGIVDPDEIAPLPENAPECFVDRVTTFVYAGTVSERYGLANIVRAFQTLKTTDLQFHVYGRGDYEYTLREISNVSSNVYYHGYVRNSDVGAILQDADYLINARSQTETFVRYSFPSKLLEYMLSGTPVITTILPGMPSEYRNHVIALPDNEAATIADTIEMAGSIDIAARVAIGIDARNFASQKSIACQGARIMHFLTNPQERLASTPLITHGGP